MSLFRVYFKLLRPFSNEKTIQHFVYLSSYTVTNLWILLKCVKNKKQKNLESWRPCRSHVEVRLCPHGRQCESREGETGCSTDLVMSPNIIQHSWRREGDGFGKRHAKRRVLPCAWSVWLHIEWKKNKSFKRAIMKALLCFTINTTVN